jgi:hypothetical protein
LSTVPLNSVHNLSIPFPLSSDFTGDRPSSPVLIKFTVFKLYVNLLSGFVACTFNEITVLSVVALTLIDRGEFFAG